MNFKFIMITSIFGLSLLSCDINDDPSPNSNLSSNISNVEGLLFLSEEEIESRTKMLPVHGSEDVSKLIDNIQIPKHIKLIDRDFSPNPMLEWIVHANFNKPLLTVDVISIFSKNLIDKYRGLTIYGQDFETGNWTYLLSNDSPAKITNLKFAWAYSITWLDDIEIVNLEIYQSRIITIQTELNKLVSVLVYSDVSPKEAYDKSVYLTKIFEQYDQSVDVRLVASKGNRFSGRDIWDVMLSLGLKWGDMNIFHWQNDSGYGDDFFFSVWTSSQPGYFLPEEIAADQLYLKDLVFGFNIPRSVDPVAVYKNMITAIKYAKKRLGGTIVSIEGYPINIEDKINELQTIADELETLGFKAGSDNALLHF